jgi:hypothetical protein
MGEVRTLLDVAVLNMRTRRDFTRPRCVPSDVRLHVPQVFMDLARNLSELGSYVVENYPHDPSDHQVLNDDVFRVQLLTWILQQINDKEMHFARASVAIRMWTVSRGELPAADTHTALEAIAMIGRHDLNFMNAFAQIPISVLRAYVKAEVRRANIVSDKVHEHNSSTNTVSYDPPPGVMPVHVYEAS